MKILVAVLTTGTRQNTFEECLRSLVAQKVNENIECHILVVENNPKALAVVSNTIEKFNSSEQRTIFHALEEHPGIPFARNCALDFAEKEGFSHLAFIDDDAFANDNWIEILSKHSDGVDVVAGPQRAYFPQHTSSFYNLAKVYHERKINNLEKINWAATNNLLISIEAIKKLKLRFNETLIHGGEDKELFLRLTMLGGEIRWVNNAIVQEYIADSRLTIKWALRRCFRMGATGFQIESCNKAAGKVFLTCCFKGAAYVAKGLLSLIPYAISSKHTMLDSLCDCSHGIGFFYGILTGGKVKQYA